MEREPNRALTLTHTSLPCKSVGAQEMKQILFHGTGARRLQSIKERGLVPKVASYVYAATHPVIAAIFATARADQEDDWALLVTFNKRGEWETDPQFPHSVRSRNAVAPSEIISLQILHPEKELEAHNKLKEIAHTIGIKIE